MAVSYKTIAKGTPGVQGGGPKKYYASIVRGRKVDLRTFVEEIAEMNTLQTPDVLAVLEAFLQMTVRHLSEGRTIDMGQLGSFSPSLSSIGQDTPEKVSKHTIKKLNVNFRPSGLLSDRLSTVKFEKVSDGSAVEEEAPAET
ncbi:HU family DNA-binding protein [Marinoscillum luteum]|uniref:HU family DNA-binding protein n=1 Tax=Marinoscillum luteum TaxID=861051 RepID=A0ABW7N7S9_9BACT